MMNLTQKNDIDCRNEKIKRIEPHVRTHTSKEGSFKTVLHLKGIFWATDGLENVADNIKI
jgi:hypothetical protein